MVETALPDGWPSGRLHLTVLAAVAGLAALAVA